LKPKGEFEVVAFSSEALRVEVAQGITKLVEAFSGASVALLHMQKKKGSMSETKRFSIAPTAARLACHVEGRWFARNLLAFFVNAVMAFIYEQLPATQSLDFEAQPFLLRLLFGPRFLDVAALYLDLLQDCLSGADFPLAPASAASSAAISHLLAQPALPLQPLSSVQLFRALLEGPGGLTALDVLFPALGFLTHAAEQGPSEKKAKASSRCFLLIGALLEAAEKLGLNALALSPQHVVVLLNLSRKPVRKPWQLRSLWERLIRCHFSPLLQSFVLAHLGISDSLWPLSLPSEMLFVAAHLLLHSPHKLNHEPAWKTVWNGVFASIEAALQPLAPEPAAPCVLPTRYFHFLLYLFHLAAEAEQELLIQRCVDLFLSPAAGSRPGECLVRARLAQFLTYFLCCSSSPSSTLVAQLESLLSPGEPSDEVPLLPEGDHFHQGYENLGNLFVDPRRRGRAGQLILCMGLSQDALCARLTALMQVFQLPLPTNEREPLYFQSFVKACARLLLVVQDSVQGEAFGFEQVLGDLVGLGGAVWLVLVFIHRGFAPASSPLGLASFGLFSRLDRLLTLAREDLNLGPQGQPHGLALVEGITSFFLLAHETALCEKNPRRQPARKFLQDHVEQLVLSFSAMVETCSHALGQARDGFLEELVEATPHTRPLLPLLRETRRAQLSLPAPAELSLASVESQAMASLFAAHSQWESHFGFPVENQSAEDWILPNVFSEGRLLELYALPEGPFRLRGGALALLLSRLLQLLVALVKTPDLSRSDPRGVQEDALTKAVLAVLAVAAPGSHLARSALGLLAFVKGKATSEKLALQRSVVALHHFFDFVSVSEMPVLANPDPFLAHEDLLLRALASLERNTQSLGLSADSSSGLGWEPLLRLFVLNSSLAVDRSLQPLLRLCGQGLSTVLPGAAFQRWLERKFLRADEKTLKDEAKTSVQVILLLAQQPAVSALLFEFFQSQLAGEGLNLAWPNFVHFFETFEKLAVATQRLPTFLSATVAVLGLAIPRKSALMLRALQQLFDKMSGVPPSARPLCSALVDRGQFSTQPWFYCFSCSLTFARGLCSACALTCHKGHDLAFARTSRFLCDCASAHAAAMENESLAASPCQCFQTDSSTEMRDALLQSQQHEALEEKLVRWCESLYIQTREHSASLAKPTTLELGQGGLVAKSEPASGLLLLQGTVSVIPLPPSKSKSDEAVEDTSKRDLISSGALQPHLLDVSSRGFFALVEGDKVRVGIVPHLFRRTGEFGRFIGVDGVVMPPQFPVCHLHFHACGDLLAVASLREFVVLQLDSTGNIGSPRAGVRVSVSHSAPILQLLWVPGTASQLLVLTKHFVKAFDPSVSTEPLFECTVIHEKLQSVCVIQQTLLVLTRSGKLFSWPMARLEAPGQSVVLRQQVPLPTHNRGLSLSYFTEAEVLFISLQGSLSLVARLAPSMDQLAGWREIGVSSTVWCRLPHSPLLFVGLSAQRVLTAVRLDGASISTQILHGSIDSLSAVPFLHAQTSLDAVAVVALHSDGLLCFGLPPMPLLQPLVEPALQPDCFAFADMECVTLDTRLGGGILRYYDQDEAKQRLLSPEQYLLCPGEAELSLTVDLLRPQMLLAGVRVLVGHSSLKHIPSGLSVGRLPEVPCKVNARRWYEFVLSPEDQWLDDTLHLVAKAGHSSTVVIDALQVYAVPRDTLLLPLEIAHEGLAARPVSSVPKQLAQLGSSALASFYRLVAAVPVSAELGSMREKFQQMLLDTSNEPLVSALHPTVLEVLRAMSGTETFYQLVDGSRSQRAFSLCQSDLQPADFVLLCRSLDEMALLRPYALLPFLRRGGCQALHDAFWRLLDRHGQSAILLDHIGRLMATLQCVLFRELLRCAEEGSPLLPAWSLFRRALAPSVEESLRLCACQEMARLLQGSEPEPEPDAAAPEFSDAMEDLEPAQDEFISYGPESPEEEEDEEGDEEEDEEDDEELRMALALSIKETNPKPPSPQQPLAPVVPKSPMAPKIVERDAATQRLLDQLFPLALEDYTALPQGPSRAPLAPLRLLLALFVADPARADHKVKQFLQAIVWPDSSAATGHVELILLSGLMAFLLHEWPDALPLAFAQLTESAGTREWFHQLHQCHTAMRSEVELKREPSKLLARNSPWSAAGPSPKSVFRLFVGPDSPLQDEGFAQPARVAVENLVRLLLSVATRSSLLGLDEWYPLLCAVLQREKARTSSEPASGLYKQTKALFVALCGSPEAYKSCRNQQQMQLLEADFRQLASQANGRLSYADTMQWMTLLSGLSKSVLAQPTHWRSFLQKSAQPHFVVVLYRACFFVPEEAVLLLLPLISAAFPDPVDAEPERSALKELLAEESPPFVLFVERFLLSSSQAVRKLAGEMILRLWCTGEAHPFLRSLLQRFLPFSLVHQGRRARQFLTLLGRMVTHSSCSEEDSQQLLSQLVNSFQETNAALRAHPNASLYRDLEQQHIDLQGFYLESEACLICNQSDAPFQEQRLEALRSETRFTENSMNVAFVQTQTIQRLVLSIHASQASCSVKTLQLSYSNKSNTTWTVAKTLSLRPGQSSVSVHFLVPITALHLLVEFVDFHTTELQEKLMCPRCNHVVRDKHGICSMCRENANQCGQCRNINYENLRAFLCNECGFCKHARFSFTLTARTSFAAPRIESQEDADRALVQLSNESSFAARRCADLMSIKQALTHLVSHTPPELGGPLPRNERESSSHSKSKDRPRVEFRRKLVDLSHEKRFTMANRLYNKESRSVLSEWCSHLLLLQGSRDELARWHSLSSSSSGFFLSLPLCFGCLNAFVSLCLELFELLASFPSVRSLLVRVGALAVLFDAEPLSLRKTDLIKSTSLLCLLVQDEEEGSAELSRRLVDALDQAVSLRHQLSFASFPHRSMKVLCESVLLQDHFWPSRLLALLDFVQRLCYDPLSEKGKEGNVSSLANHHLLNQHVFLPALHTLLSLCQSPNPLPLMSRPAVAAKAQEGETGEQMFQKWKSLVDQKGNEGEMSDEDAPSILNDCHWLVQMAMSNASPAVQKAASQLLGILASHPSRRRSVLDLCQRSLRRYIAHPVNEASLSEFFQLFHKVLEESEETNKDTFATELMDWISGQVRHLQQRERLGDLSTPNNEGELLLQLVRLARSTLQKGERAGVNESLATALLDNYLSLRSLVLLQSERVENSCNLLIELFSSAESNASSRRGLIVACIRALEKHGNERRTPLFIVEQVNNIVSPPKDEPERLCTLVKSASQEEFIRGAMNKNPYSSKTCGPLMRDVKNKICRDLSLHGLLEDDNGMELLVANKIIKLDLPLVGVFDSVWSVSEGAGSPPRPMTIVFRLQGLDGEATEEIVESLPQSEAEADEGQESFAITQTIADCGGLPVLLDLLARLDFLVDQALAGKLLKLLSYCTTLPSNSVALLALKAAPLLLAKLNAAFPVEALAAEAELLLSILERLIRQEGEAAAEGPALSLQEQENQMSLFLSKLDAPVALHNAQMLRSLAVLLPALTYGQPAIVDRLVLFFSSLPWAQPAPLASGLAHQMQSFVLLSESLRADANSSLLRVAFLRQVTPSLMAFLVETLPLPSDSPALWETSREGSALRFALPALAGLVRGFAPAQALALTLPRLLPGLAALSSMATKEKLGNAAEALLDALALDFEPVRAALLALRETEKTAKEELARLHRARVLAQMGLVQTPGASIGKVLAAAPAFGEDLEEEEEFACKVCKERAGPTAAASPS
jgi:hypothetical protein